MNQKHTKTVIGAFMAIAVVGVAGYWVSTETRANAGGTGAQETSRNPAAKKSMEDSAVRTRYFQPIGNSDPVRAAARNEARDLYVRASDAINEGSLETAERLLSEGLRKEVFGKSVEVTDTSRLSSLGQTLRAELLLHYGRPGDALKIMEGVSIGGHRERRTKAVCYFELKMYDECEAIVPASVLWDIAGAHEVIAKQCFLEACTVRQLRARIYAARGSYSRSVGDSLAAAHYFEYAVEADPHNPLLKYWLGMAYQISGDVGAALRQYEQIPAISEPIFAESVRRGISSCRQLLGLPY